MPEIFLILGLITVLAVFLAWPRTGLYALALAAPVIGWLLYWGNLVFTPIDIIAILAIAAFFLRVLYQGFFRVREPIKLEWPLFFPFSIFLGISLLSSCLSADPLYSLWYVVRWLLLLYLGYVVVPYNLITSGKVLKKAIIALALSSLVVLISGFLSLYGQDWSDSFFRLRSVAWFGIFPFGDNHNLIAEFLNVGLFLMLVLKDLASREVTKKLWIVAAVFAAVGIVLTFSRTGWITLGLQLIIYFGYRLKNRMKFSSIAFATLGLLILLSPLLWKMNQLQQDNVSSTENRWLLTEIAWGAFQDKPYLGAGSGQFTRLVGNNIRFTAKYGEPVDSHGMIQKVAAENGVFGLAAWIFLLLCLLRTGAQSLKRYYQNHPWILPLFLAAAGGLFFQFFNTSYYKGKVWLPIALFLAAVRLLEKKYESKDKK